jgi:hypothetical protein
MTPKRAARGAPAGLLGPLLTNVLEGEFPEVRIHDPEWPRSNTYEHRLHRWLMFFLQNTAFDKWAMLGSNQRPLPCEVKSSGSQGFADVHEPA